MSKQYTDAKLDGWDGPYFPKAIEALTDAKYAHHEFSANGASLEEIGKQIPGYVGETWPETSDGYGWFWALEWKLDSGSIQLLFPWAVEQLGKLDRSIAAYTMGSISTEVLESHISEFTRLYGEQNY